MEFKDLLDVLDSDEQLFVTVTNEWGDGGYEGTVEKLREEELLTNLRVEQVYTRIIEDEEQSNACPNRVAFALTSQIEVTLYDAEHDIIYPED